ncbi:hypothetical protein K4L44_07075 [Halosquirtibacter laminarini]|uniref:Uncharacterized protein n=1 Tax=Halosquirtibacter laminarini TaxID=3374600 RepID=A0AC61NPZ6_9BACT|nr:hypothetical protein K4L44_07075 [Prolixibacteraceae bacterium]
MKHIFTIESIDPTDLKKVEEFILFAKKIYQDHPLWGHPLDIDVEKHILPSKNQMLQNGHFTLWLVRDNKNNIMARIAAFAPNNSTIGKIGFFESIDNLEVSSLLFNTAKRWMLSKGMKAIEGPVNFGMRDEFWGCLVEGEHPPVYNMPYNPPYYKNLFESFGFLNYFDQITYLRPLEPNILHPLVTKAGKRVLQNTDYTIRNIGKEDPMLPHYFREIYNKAWASFEGVPPISIEEAIRQMKLIKPIIDKRLIIFGFYKDQPISFFILMPDIGQIFKTFHGKFGWYQKLKFLYSIKRGKFIDRIIGRIFGVIPEFQGKGIEAAMIVHFENIVLQPGFPYKTLELNWIGDFNPSMMKVCRMIGGHKHKKHTTYHLPISKDFVFKRATIVNK